MNNTGYGKHMEYEITLVRISPRISEKLKGSKKPFLLAGHRYVDRVDITDCMLTGENATEEGIASMERTLLNREIFPEEPGKQAKEVLGTFGVCEFSSRYPLIVEMGEQTLQAHVHRYMPVQTQLIPG